MIRRTALFTALLATGLAGAMTLQSVQAAEIKIVNQDVGTGQGLDDHTPAVPLGGNPGTTRGEQALIVFQFAADLWGAVLQSDVPIINTATFQPLSCDATSGVLGSSGTNYIFSFNPGSTLPAGALADTWYHSALADALAGTDLGVENDLPPDTPDIISRFNGKLGQPGCLEGSAWYFGLDGNTPAGEINFLDVVMHEMSHGLGFSGFNNLVAGTLNQGVPDIYSTYVKDDTTGKMWIAMTDAERQVAALDDGNLVFTGNHAITEAPLALSPLIAFEVSSPSAIAGDYDYNVAQFGATPTPANFSGEIAVSSGADNLGCNVDGAAAPVPGVSGKLALIDRGTCAFVEKAANAQAGGATGLIIANNEDVGLIPAGDDPSITIPVIAVSLSDGNTLKANLPVTAGLVQKPGLGGTDADGNVQLYAPTTLAQGSSFSHYDTRLTPNALMEYAISNDLEANLDVDLTPALFKDIGWVVNVGNQQLLGCDTGVPTSVPGGAIVGANIYGNARVLAGAAADVDAYRQSIRDYAGSLATGGLITGDQASSLNLCLSDDATQAQFDEWGGDNGGPGDGGDAIELANGVALGGQSGTAGASTVYMLVVPDGARALSIRTYGGSGDVSVYVKVGEPGGADDFDFKSTHRGNNESVVRARPAAGTYYITVVGEANYSGVTVMGNFISR